MSEELLPCPFCGGDAISMYVRDGREIGCRKCGATGARQHHGPLDKPSAEERARAAWNTRPALIDHLEADGGVEAMRERCAKAAEDRFEYVRKGVPDSDFLEAARLIAEDIRALPVLGVGR